MSVQDVRNMTADQVHRYVPVIIERMCLQAIGELDPPMDKIELQCANALVDRILPRLQGIAIQGQVQHKIEWTWKK